MSKHQSDQKMSGKFPGQNAIAWSRKEKFLNLNRS